MTHLRTIYFFQNPVMTNFGLRLGRISLKHTEKIECDIYVEKHQGKHANGNWDYRSGRGSMFEDEVASRDNLNLFRVIATVIHWVDTINLGGGANGVVKGFSFAHRVSRKTNLVRVQCVYDQRRFFEFHCYPDDKGTATPHIEINAARYAEMVRQFDLRTG